MKNIREKKKSQQQAEDSCSVFLPHLFLHLNSPRRASPQPHPSSLDRCLPSFPLPSLLLSGHTSGWKRRRWHRERVTTARTINMKTKPLTTPANTATMGEDSALLGLSGEEGTFLTIFDLTGEKIMLLTLLLSYSSPCILSNTAEESKTHPKL